MNYNNREEGDVEVKPQYSVMGARVEKTLLAPMMN